MKTVRLNHPARRIGGGQFATPKGSQIVRRAKAAPQFKEPIFDAVAARTRLQRNKVYRHRVELDLPADDRCPLFKKAS
jgi:hypothetical protein